MRVSNQYLTQTIIRNLNSQTEQILKTQKMIFTGKKVNRPSDNPSATERILDYRTTLSSIDQYMRNITQGKTRIELVEETLGAVGDLVHQAKNWAAEMSSGSNNAQTMAIAADDVKLIYDQVIQLANTTMNNRYIFSGYQTGTPPFTRNADGIDGTADDYTAVYNGDNNDFSIIVGDNADIALKADGEEIFQGVVDVFGSLQDLIQGLETNDIPLVSGQVPLLSQAQDQIEKIRATGAAQYNRMEVMENLWESFTLKVQDMLSEDEDTDITEAILRLQSLQNTYEVSLETSARIIQPSLINFLS